MNCNSLNEGVLVSWLVEFLPPLLLRACEPQKLRRQLCLQLQWLTGHRVPQRQLHSPKEQTLMPKAQLLILLVTVQPIADDRVTYAGEMLPELMLPAGVRPQVQQCHVACEAQRAEALHHLVPAGSLLAIHFLLDVPLTLEQPCHQRHILLLHLPLLKHAIESHRGGRRFCTNQQTAGELVQAVHGVRTGQSARGTAGLQAPSQHVLHGLPAPAMHHHPREFHDHRHVVIFVHRL
mmetsp:Transcript_24690/g.43976  ORF Transcript_24690/g.43976 Transcript_24690/m.43976 type:complete len:235 (+) Transcript_24690:341-1045(+)